MWFFVSSFYGQLRNLHADDEIVILPDEERRSCITRLETSLGTLNNVHTSTIMILGTPPHYLQDIKMGNNF